MSTRLEEMSLIEYLDSNNRVDEEKGILRGVKLLGENSKNGRRYLPEAMKKAVPLYEGRKMYLNHPGPNEAAERKFEVWLGVYRNAQYVEGKGIFADAYLRKESGYFKGIVEAARDFPNDAGLSHVADGDSVMEGRSEIVESISEVFSVDLVTDPATTAGWFEGVMKTKKKTVKQIIEAAPEDTKHRKRLLESVEAGTLDSETEIEVPGDANPATEVALAIAEIVAPELSPPAEPNQESDKKLVDAEKRLTEQAGKIAQLEAKQLLLESNIEATEVRIKALAATPEADRSALLESWPVIDSVERPKRIPGMVESVETSKESIHSAFAAMERR
jgi:hypothetical protein